MPEIIENIHIDIDRKRREESRITNNKPYMLKITRYYLRKFTGSERLFRACWRQYRQYLNTSIDQPKSDDEVMGWLEQIASEKVNNPKSQFYIHG